MKDIGRIKGQFDTERQDGKILEEMRPVMQEKARVYNIASAKSRKSFILTCCLVIMAVMITAACFTPTLVAYATDKQEKDLGWISEFQARISFEQYFGASGERGVYYFDRHAILSEIFYETVNYDKRLPDERLYSQHFKDENGKTMLRLFVMESRLNSVFFSAEFCKEAQYKEITYYYCRELIVKNGVDVIVHNGEYDYLITYPNAEESEDNFLLIPKYLDLLFKL